MKVFYFICILSIFQIFNPLELGGIKFAISEQMAYDLLYHFFPSIRKQINTIPIENIHVERGVNVEDIVLSITKFSLDQIKLKFTEKGINITISGLEAVVTAVVYINKWPVVTDKDIRIDIHEFSMNGNIMVYSKIDKNGKLVPCANFTSPPTHTIDLDVDLENTLWFVDELLEPKIRRKLEDAIDTAIKEKSNDFLNQALDVAKNYTVMPIDESKGLYIDYSLVDIKMRNGYLELNSFAFLYNKNKPETMQNKRLPLTLLPPISSVDNPNQLFISEYSLNSALYTYFITIPLSIKLDINKALLEELFPTFAKEIIEKTEVFFETTDPPTLNLKLNYIKGEIYGKIIIKVEEKEEIVCFLHINTKVELIIMDDINLSGQIYELEISVQKIEVGEVHAKLLIEKVNKVSPIILVALNSYIKEKVKFTLPIFFKNAEISQKMTYLGINYRLKKEIYESVLDSILSKIKTSFKKFYYNTNSKNYTDGITEINQQILQIFKTLFPDQEKDLTKGYQEINDISLKIPPTVQYYNYRDQNLDLLYKKITDFGITFNIPNNPLSNLGYFISNFMKRNIDSLNYPPYIQNEQCRVTLNAYLSGAICTIKESTLNHHSLNKNYFIWAKYDYSSCYGKWNY